jgi:hypothetical protein
MAYNDYQMGGYIPGDYETPEERRRRLEQEQAQAQDLESGGITAQRPGTGFMDVAGRYVDNRIGAAQQRVADVGQMFEDPEAALQRRMGLAVAEQPVEPTPVKQTITTDPRTGEQKMTISGSVQDLTAANPLTPTVSQPVTPGQAVAQDQQAQAQQLMQMPDAQQREQAAVERMRAAAAATQPPAEAAPVPAVPQDMVAGGGVPARPDIGTVPTPGPAVQVAQAGPVNPAAPVVQQAPAAAPGASLAQMGQAVTARPQWAVDLEAAGTDQDKLIDIAANKTYPQPVRDDAKAKLRQAQDQEIAAKDAEKTVAAAAQGDPAAQQKLLNSIKPANIKREEGKVAEGKVTEGSYIRAYLYARLGLNDLAKEEQEKIMGGSKFGQVTVDGKSYEVDTDRRTGRVKSALDASGNAVDTQTLNKIRAESAKFGTKAFGFTGGSATIPAGQADAGQEYRQRTNEITGQIENIITTGENRGKVYGGPPGLEKRVETNAAVKLNDAYIDYETKPTIAMATKMLELAGQADKGDGKTIARTMDRIRTQSPAIFTRIQPLVSDLTGQDAGGGGKVGGTAQGGGKVGGTAQGSGTVGGTAQGGGGGSLLQQTTGQVESIKTGEELKRAELKPPAEAKGQQAATDIKNQGFADRTYDLFKPINEAILKSTGSSIGAGVDTMVGAFGRSTEGSKAIKRLNVLSYNILANIPRFEGPQSDIDVKMYTQAAGAFNDKTAPVEDRLAALDALRTILQRYDKAGKNDWSFGTAGGANTDVRSRADKIIGK